MASSQGGCKSSCGLMIMHGKYLMSHDWDEGRALLLYAHGFKNCKFCTTEVPLGSPGCTKTDPLVQMVSESFRLRFCLSREDVCRTRASERDAVRLGGPSFLKPHKYAKLLSGVVCADVRGSAGVHVGLWVFSKRVFVATITKGQGYHFS